SWTEQNGRKVIQGGTQQDSSTASYSYADGSGWADAANDGSAPAPGPQTNPVVQFSSPDATAVAQAQFGPPPASPAVGAQPALGQAATGGMAPGATAPVPISVNVQMVSATGDWAGATQQGAQQAVGGRVTQVTLNGPAAGASQALLQLQKRADNAD